MKCGAYSMVSENDFSRSENDVSHLYSLAIGLYIFFVAVEDILAFGMFDALTKLAAAGVVGIAVLTIVLERRRIAIGMPEALLLAFLAWSISTTAWALNVDMAISRIPTVVMLVAFTLIAGFRGFSSRELRILLYAVLASGLCVAVYLFIFGTEYHDRVARVTLGDKSDPNHLGASMLLAFMVGVSLLMREKSTWSQRAVAAVSLLPLGWAFQATGSRGSLTALVGMVVFYFVLKRKFIWLLVFILAFSGVMILNWDNTESRFSGQYLFERDSTGAGRTEIWEIGRKAMAENWLVGGGLSNFPALYNVEALGTMTGFSRGVDRAAHNTSMEIISELGIVGFALFGGFLWYLVKAHGKKRSEEHLTLIAALAGNMASSMFLDIQYRKYFWLIILLLYGLGRMAAQKDPEVMDETD